MQKKLSLLIALVLTSSSLLFSQRKTVIVDSLIQAKIDTNAIPAVHTVQLSSDNNLVLSITVSSANVWNLKTMKKVFTVNGFFVDGCLGNDGMVYLDNETALQSWDMASGKKLNEVAIAGSAHVTWYPLVKTILVTDIKSVYLMDFTFNKSPVIAAGKGALSADGKMLATVSVNEDQVSIWGVTGIGVRPMKKFAQPAQKKMQAFTLSNHGDYLEGTYASSAICYNTKTGKILADKFMRYSVPVHQFSATGSEFFSADDRADFFIDNLKTHHEVNIYNNKFDEYHQPVGYFFSYATSFPIGSKYSGSVLIDRDMGTGIYNTTSGALQTTFIISENARGNNTIKHRSVYDAAKQRIICISQNGAIRIFGMDGKLQGPKKFITTKTPLNLNLMYLANDGKTLAVAGGQYVYICKL